MVENRHRHNNLDTPENYAESFSMSATHKQVLLEVANSDDSLEQFRLRVLNCFKYKFLVPLLQILVAVLSLLGIIDGLLRLLITLEITYGKELAPILPGPALVGSLLCGLLAVGGYFLEKFLTWQDVLYQKQAQQALEVKLPKTSLKLSKAQSEYERLELKFQQIEAELKLEQDVNRRSHSKNVELELALKLEKENQARTNQNLNSIQARNRELEEKVAQALLKVERAEATASSKVLPVVQKLKENLTLVEWVEGELKKMSQRSPDTGMANNNKWGSNQPDNENENKESTISSVPAKKPPSPSTTPKAKGNRNYLGGAYISMPKKAEVAQNRPFWQGFETDEPSSNFNRLSTLQGCYSQNEKKKGRTSRTVQLTERDRAILRRIGQGQVATLGQLTELFWKETGPAEDKNEDKGNSHRKEEELLRKATSKPKQKTAQIRLAQLTASGYLETTYTNARRPGEQVYSLTPKGAALLTPLEQERVVVGLPASNEMRQQLDAQDARLILEKWLKARDEQLLDWKSEREIRSEAFQERNRREAELGRKLIPEELEQLPELPDATALIEQADGSTYKIDLEIDGHYFGQKLARKLEGFIAWGRASGREIIWATSSRRRAERVATQIAQAGADDVLSVMLLT